MTADVAGKFTSRPCGWSLAVSEITAARLKNEIGSSLGGELKIKVTALPMDAAANEALVKFLAYKLNCLRGKVELIRGHTSRHKTVLLHGFKLDEVLRQIAGRG